MKIYSTNETYENILLLQGMSAQRVVRLDSIGEETLGVVDMAIVQDNSHTDIEMLMRFTNDDSHNTVKTPVLHFTRCVDNGMADTCTCFPDRTTQPGGIL